MGTIKSLVSLLYHGWPKFDQKGFYLGPLPARCPHPEGHKPLLGWDPVTKVWKTSLSAAYPPGLCQAIAELIVLDFLSSDLPSVGQVGALGFGLADDQVRESVPQPPRVQQRSLPEAAASDMASKLGLISWPPSARSYVSGRALCVGTISSSRGGASLWFGNEQLQRLIKDLNHILSSVIPVSEWNSTWTSLQINHNTVADWHKDEKNRGLSVILSVGSYSGGRFILEGSPPLDIRNRAVLFDGSVRHCSEPFEGERWSIVAFTSSALDLCDQKQRSKLRSMGFRLPLPPPPPRRSSPLAKGKRRPRPGQVYVGRNRAITGSKWGNPHKGQDMTPEVAVARFEADLRSTDELVWSIAELADKDLVCHCPPDQPCHIDSIIKVFKERFEIATEVVATDHWEDLRRHYADKDTSDEDSSGRSRQPLGSGHWGRGRPLF